MSAVTFTSTQTYVSQHSNTQTHTYSQKYMHINLKRFYNALKADSHLGNKMGLPLSATRMFLSTLQ